VQIHKMKNFVQVSFRPLISTDKTYVGCKYTKYITSSGRLLFFRNYTNFMTFREEIYEFVHFVRMVASAFIEHRSAGGWARKYQWFDLCTL